MSYEKLEPHGRLTVAAAEFAWNFYMRASTLNQDEHGNSVVSPTLVQYQLVLMTMMSSGETRKQLLRAMRLNDNENVNELMRWNLWVIDYYMREAKAAYHTGKNDVISVALSYGTKPRSAMVIARKQPLKYKENILQWINHYRTRKSYHVVPTLKGVEPQISGIVRRLTGAYPKDMMFDELFAPHTFTEETRAIVANKLHFQLFVPSTAAMMQVSDHRVAFWRTPVDNNPIQGDEQLRKVRVIKLIKKFEYLEDEHCQLIGVDVYPANLTAYFMLPKPGFAEDGSLLNVNQTLVMLERKLNGRTMHNYIQKLLPQRTKRTTQLMLTLPCFTLRMSSDLEQPIKNIGLECLFDPKNKDWTELFVDANPGGGDFYLSNAKQSAQVQMLPTSAASNYFLTPPGKRTPFPTDWTDQQLTFNRPFLFFLYDHFSRVFLVFGRCQNPCEKRD